MPTYEYACRDCGEHLEIVQSFKDAPLTECGRCGGALRKVFSPAGIIFKGSGYYVNDSRKPAESSSSSSTSKDSSTTNDASKSESSSNTAKPSETKKSDSSGSADSAAKSA